MPTKVKRTLLVTNKDDAKTYLNADGVSLGITSFGNYILARLYMNGGKNGYAILNDTSKAILYPNDKAHPVEADVNFFTSVLTNNKNCLVGLLFDDSQVASQIPPTSGIYTDVKGLKDEAILQSSKNSVIRFHLHANNTVNAVTLQEINLSLYFMQYACTAKSVSNTVTATVDKAEAYDGDIVTFTATVADGETFEGWYSDVACTNLVSTDQIYSVSPTSDLTLYAKDTHDVKLFTCAAVAGANISSASVSDSAIPVNGSCTFSATTNTGCIFDGWYSDESCTHLVSTTNPYVVTITANTTLYAKAHLSKLNISVGQAEHGTASVNASVITYGDNAIFTFNPESDDYKLYGWYADEGLTQLVSEDNPYICTPTTDYKLYPKSGAVMYTIKLTRGLKGVAGRSGTWTLKIAALYYDQLTYNEKQYVKTGEFDKIESSKVLGQTTKTGVDMIAAIKTSLQVPANTTCAIWCQLSDAPVTCFAESGDISLGERSMLTYWPYYIFTPTQDKEYFCYYSDSACICTAVAKDGIEYADATTPTFAGKDAMFTAIVKEGYIFRGWYSDEECTTFISSDNPLSITTPSVNKDSADPQDNETTTSELTLYARARSITGKSDILYFKVNGSYKSATKVYKKVSGTWVEQTDLPTIFSGGSNGAASNYVYGGSV